MYEPRFVGRVKKPDIGNAVQFSSFCYRAALDDDNSGLVLARIPTLIHAFVHFQIFLTFTVHHDDVACFVIVLLFMFVSVV